MFVFWQTISGVEFVFVTFDYAEFIDWVRGKIILNEYLVHSEWVHVEEKLNLHPLLSFWVANSESVP